MSFVSDYEVVKWTSSWPHPADREFVASRCVSVDPELGFGGPVFLGDEQIGGIGILNGELGYFFARKHWGKGYATEAMTAFLSDIFQRFPIDEICASHFDDNPASGRVLTKLGFTQTGKAMGSSAARLEDAPETLYRLTRTKFEAQP